MTTTLGLEYDSEDEHMVKEVPAEKEAPVERSYIDAAQKKAGSLATMCKKVAHRLGRSAKAEKRAALNRDSKAAPRATVGRLPRAWGHTPFRPKVGIQRQ